MDKAIQVVVHVAGSGAQEAIWGRRLEEGDTHGNMKWMMHVLRNH
jgi:hypothetical protein